jgi:UDP-N-acetylglucosamine 2-epimerase (non-hydrolysing)
MSGMRAERILQAVEIVTSQHRGRDADGLFVQDYRSEQVARQVVRIVMSYTDYVNRTVWSRSA